MAEVVAPDAGSKDRRIQHVLRLIHSKPWLRAHQLASRVSFSPSRLRHLFKKQMGSSIRKYRKEHQLQRARRLLIRTNLPLKEICIAVGIKDVSNFVRYFKLRFGITPAAHRRQFCRRR